MLPSHHAQTTKSLSATPICQPHCCTKTTYGRNPLDVVGVTELQLRKRDTKVLEEVLRHQTHAHQLELVARLDSISNPNMGFWQIPLTEDSAKYTTYITPFGHYHFNRLPFGIASAPEHFQNRMVTEVTDGLQGVVCTWMMYCCGDGRRRSMTPV